ncbi:ATP-binding protein [Candidatus Woesearchaeota archaeon]|nr:ATP-binding protein [Candidatus Woesearchaeota archaeon]
MAMRIVVTGGKGGTGKSTVAAALAYELSKTKKTLLVDADVDCPNDHLILSVKRKKIKDVLQFIPEFKLDECTKCGKCAEICKQHSIVFVPGKYPAFVPETCTGCKACMAVCPSGAIKEGSKKIGSVYDGKNFGINLVSGELKVGEPVSGELVVETIRVAEKIAANRKMEAMIVDSAAGIGCPVIASIAGSDYAVAVTEPSPSALSDLQRVLLVIRHFRIPCGLMINKHNLSKSFCRKIEAFASKNKIPVIGRIPYSKRIMESTIKMKPVNAYDKQFTGIFSNTLKNIRQRNVEE